MASSNGTRSCPPLASRLAAIFEALPDSELLASLRLDPRGRKGYGDTIMWRCYVASFVLNIPSVAALVRALNDNPCLASACGIASPEGIPSKYAFCRFLKKLASRQATIQGMVRDVAERLKETMPDFGQVISVDSTDVTAWSQSHRPSDHDARWAKKKNKHGRDHWWFGFKVHLAVSHEIPMAVEVTSANVADSQALPTVMTRVRMAHPDWPISHVLADAGYDSGENYRFVIEDLGAIPIIKLNRRGAKKPLSLPHRSKAIQATHSYRINPPVAQDSPEFERLYSLRSGAERCISRLKCQHKLNRLTNRGIGKVTVHCLLSVLALQVHSLCAIIAGAAKRAA